MFPSGKRKIKRFINKIETFSILDMEKIDIFTVKNVFDCFVIFVYLFVEIKRMKFIVNSIKMSIKALRMIKNVGFYEV